MDKRKINNNAEEGERGEMRGGGFDSDVIARGRVGRGGGREGGPTKT